MPKYYVNGKTYNIPEEKEKDFLLAYPKAELKSPLKNFQEDTTEGPTEVSDTTGSTSEDTSSDSSSTEDPSVSVPEVEIQAGVMEFEEFYQSATKNRGLVERTTSTTLNEHHKGYAGLNFDHTGIGDGLFLGNKITIESDFILNGKQKIKLPKADADKKKWERAYKKYKSLVELHNLGASTRAVTHEEKRKVRQDNKRVIDNITVQNLNYDLKDALEVEKDPDRIQELKDAIEFNNNNIEAVANSQNEITPLTTAQQKLDEWNETVGKDLEQEYRVEYMRDNDPTEGGDNYEIERENYINQKLNEERAKQNPIQSEVVDNYQKAIEELKTHKGYDGFDSEKEGEYNDLGWVGKDESKLLDGLSYKEVQALAAGDLSEEWQDMHIAKLQKQMYTQSQFELQGEIDQVNAAGRDIEQRQADLEAEKADIETQSQQIQKQYDDISPEFKRVQDLLEGEASLLKDLEKDINEEQDEVTRQNLVDEYNSTAQSYNENFETYKNLRSKIEDLMQKSQGVQNRQEQYNQSADQLRLDSAELLEKANDLELKQTEIDVRYNFNIAEKTFNNNFEITDDYYEWKNKNVNDTSGLMGSVRDLGNRIVQGVSREVLDLYVGTGVWATNMLGSYIKGATGLGSYSDSEYVYDRYDRLNNLYVNYKSSIFAGLPVADEIGRKEGAILGGYKHSMQTLGNMLPFTLALIGSARKGDFVKTQRAYKMLASKGINQKNLQAIKTAETAFRLTTMDNYADGKNLGLSDDQALEYAGTMSLITSIASTIMPDYRLLGGTTKMKTLLTAFQGDLKNAVTKKAAAAAGKQFVVDYVKELGEEEVELVLGDLAKHSFGLSHAAEFNKAETHQQILEGTLLLSGSLKAAGNLTGSGDYTSFKNQIYDGFRSRGSEVIQDIESQMADVQAKIDQATLIGDDIKVDLYKQMYGELLQGRDYAMLINNAVNLSPESVTNEQLDLVIQKQELVNMKKDMDPAFHSMYDNQIKEIDAKIASSDVMAVTEKMFDKTTENATKMGEKMGIKVLVFDGDNSTQEMYDWAAENTGAGSQNLEESIGSHGGATTDIDGNQVMLINKPVSLSATGTNVAAHEMLHKMMAMTLAQKDADGNIMRDENGEMIVNIEAAMALQQGLGSEILKMDASKISDSILSARVRAYQKAPASVQAQELLTLFSDALATGDIKFEENVFTKIGDFVRGAMQKMGMPITFRNGRSVFNFLRDYNASVQKGEFNAAQEKMFLEGAKFKGEIEKLKTSEDITEAARKERLFNETEGLPSEYLMSREEDSQRVQDIYEDQGVGGAFEIFEQFKPITIRIARRYREVPGYDEQLLIDEIETGRRGILDLIQDYDSSSGVPLAAYINKFLPARSIEAANRILKTEFEDDVTEARGVVAEEAVEQRETRKTKLIVVAEKLGVESDIESEVTAANIDMSKVNNFKQVPNAATNTVGALLGISPTKIKSKANLTSAEVRSAQQFFLKNARLVIDAMPEGFDTDGQATGVPRTVLAAMYNQRETRAKTKAGLKFHVKRNNIKDSELLELVDVIDGRPTKTRNTSARVIALADMLGKVMTNQEIRRQNPGFSNIRSGMTDILFSQEPEFFYNSFNSVRKNSGVSIPLLGYQLEKDFVNEKTRTGMRDMDAEYAPGITFDQQATLVANQFIQDNPEFKNIIQVTMTGGIRGGLFLTVPEFDSRVKVKSDVKYKRYKYNSDKKLTKKAVEDFQNQKVTEERNNRLNVLYNFYKAVETHLSQNPQDQWFFEAFARDGSRGQSGNPILNLEAVEEHSMPQNNVGYGLLNAAIDGNVDQVFPAIEATYMQLSLLKTDDDILRESGLESSMPQVYYDSVLPRLMNGDLVVPKGLAAAARLAAPGTKYAPKTGSKAIDLNSYFMPEINMTMAQYFGVDGIKDIAYANSLVMQQLTGQIGAVTTFNHSKDEAINLARKTTHKTPSRGMSTFDFDETLIIDGENFIVATKGKDKVKISSGDWPILGPEYAADGYNFDFTDFVNVRGGVDGPLLQKMKNQINKYGPENVFILTARPAEAAEAIHGWLKTKGIKISIDNITGLGNSTGDAKAEWFLQKYAEGYNDMYFVDDALPNVNAVKHVFNQLDIKGKSVQAKIKFSKDLDLEFNSMLERTKGVGALKRFSRVEASKRGKNKGKFTLFVPPSAEDFTGLLRYFVGTGAQGNADIKFFEESLVKPFARADREMSLMKQKIRDEYKALRKKYPEVSKKLGKLIDDSGFTFDNAIRVYLYNKAGFEIPGLSKAAQARLISTVKNDKDLFAYANAVGAISKQQEGYLEPEENWNVGNIASDLQSVVNKVSRAQFLSEWIENKDIIFSPENLNKIEAVYGSNFRSALEDVLYAMQTGQNRRSKATKFENQWNNWINNSVGAIMFFNARSAVLQTLSTVNFVNFEDNNIFAAAKAFANQKQYWSDFSMLFNSDFLKNRRAGLATNINEAELASAVAGASNKAKAAIGYLLKIGFTPTQIADSFAIASGGATFYRNRLNKYLKQGMSQAEAESQAMLDFREIAEETQQSARPDRISQQQRSNLGRVILAFANTPMQYNRLIKKAAGDLINRRGDWRSNVSRILYYGAVQNFIFAAMQNALFALAFDDEEDEKQEIKNQRIINSMIDSLLRGSGVYGAALATLKNAYMEFIDQNKKGFDADYNEVVIEALNVSPPIGSKARKISSAGKTIKWNSEVIRRMDALDWNNPMWLAIGNTVEATTNIPMARAIRKIDNIKEALNKDNTNMQRLFLLNGWSSWDLNVGEKVIRNEGKENEYVVYLDERGQAVESVKQEIREEKKQETIRRKEEKKKQKEKEQEAVIKENLEKQKEEGEKATCAAVSSKGNRCKRKPVKDGFCTVHEKVEQNQTGKKAQCKKVKSDGKRCKMQTNSKSGFCYYHD
jgi:hypothetical protein